MLQTNENYLDNSSVLLSNTARSSEMDYITSLQIAEITGKQHAHVMRDIRSLLEQGVHESNFGLMYRINKLGNGAERKDPYYNLTKKGSLILASGYDAKLREKIIDRWEELEIEKQKNELGLPSNYLDALKQLVASEEEKQRLQADNQQKQIVIEIKTEENNVLKDTIKRQAPAVEYVSTTLMSTRTYTSTQISKELGLRSAKELHKKLKEWGVMYYQSGQWMLTAKYSGRGYTKPRTQSGMDEHGNAWSNTITVWTETGRKFLHEFYNAKMSA